MINSPIGLVSRHLLIGSILLVPMVPRLAHAVEILRLWLPGNTIWMSHDHLALTLAHSRVLLGVMLTICSTLDESGRELDRVGDTWLLVPYGRGIDGGCLAIFHIILLLLPYADH